tara:strand:- start:273 stop:2192 length:1920 start_codon:yes stop_codon:yes gene_type:complete
MSFFKGFLDFAGAAANSYTAAEERRTEDGGYSDGTRKKFDDFITNRQAAVRGEFDEYKAKSAIFEEAAKTVMTALGEPTDPSTQLTGGEAAVQLMRGKTSDQIMQMASKLSAGQADGQNIRELFGDSLNRGDASKELRNYDAKQIARMQMGGGFKYNEQKFNFGANQTGVRSFLRDNLGLFKESDAEYEKVQSEDQRQRVRSSLAGYDRYAQEEGAEPLREARGSVNFDASKFRTEDERLDAKTKMAQYNLTLERTRELRGRPGERSAAAEMKVAAAERKAATEFFPARVNGILDLVGSTVEKRPTELKGLDSKGNPEARTKALKAAQKDWDYAYQERTNNAIRATLWETPREYWKDITLNIIPTLQTTKEGLSSMKTFVAVQMAGQENADPNDNIYVKYQKGAMRVFDEMEKEFKPELVRGLFRRNMSKKEFADYQRAEKAQPLVDEKAAKGGFSTQVPSQTPPVNAATATASPESSNKNAATAPASSDKEKPWRTPPATYPTASDSTTPEVSSTAKQRIIDNVFLIDKKNSKPRDLLRPSRDGLLPVPPEELVGMTSKKLEELIAVSKGLIEDLNMAYVEPRDKVPGEGPSKGRDQLLGSDPDYTKAYIEELEKFERQRNAISKVLKARGPFYKIGS